MYLIIVNKRKEKNTKLELINMRIYQKSMSIKNKFSFPILRLHSYFLIEAENSKHQITWE